MLYATDSSTFCPRRTQLQIRSREVRFGLNCHFASYNYFPIFEKAYQESPGDRSERNSGEHSIPVHPSAPYSNACFSIWAAPWSCIQKWQLVQRGIVYHRRVPGWPHPRIGRQDHRKVKCHFEWSIWSFEIGGSSDCHAILRWICFVHWSLTNS